MLNSIEYSNLESKWEKYNSSKKNKFYLLIFLCFGFVLILSSVFFYFNNKVILKDDNLELHKKENAIISENKELQEPIINNIVSKDSTNIQEEKVKTDESVNIQNNIEENKSSKFLYPNLSLSTFNKDNSLPQGEISLQYITPTTVNKNIKNMKTLINPPIEDIALPNVVIKNVESVPSPVKLEDLSLKIIDKEIIADTIVDKIPPEDKSRNDIKIKFIELDDFKNLKIKFNQTKNPIFAVMLAEKYYESKQYNKAISWSLSANNLDPRNEKSWIIFAKAKNKLGKKDEAIKILKSYLSIATSVEAKALLDEIKKGTFR